MGQVWVLFDGLPGPLGPRFIEVEDAQGAGKRAGEWTPDPRKADQGWHRLGPFIDAGPTLEGRIHNAIMAHGQALIDSHAASDLADSIAELLRGDLLEPPDAHQLGDEAAPEEWIRLGTDHVDSFGGKVTEPAEDFAPDPMRHVRRMFGG